METLNCRGKRLSSIRSKRPLTRIYVLPPLSNADSEFYLGGHGEASRRGKSVWAAYVHSFSHLKKLPAVGNAQGDSDGLRAQGIRPRLPVIPLIGYWLILEELDGQIARL